MPNSVSWPSGMYLVIASALRMSERTTMTSICHWLVMVGVYAVSVEKEERIGSCSTKTNIEEQSAQAFHFQRVDRQPISPATSGDAPQGG